jgi:hypothetical protein
VADSLAPHASTSSHLQHLLCSTSCAAAGQFPPASFCDKPPKKIPYYRLKPIHFGH